MSQWSHNNPEKMAEIADLPMSQQNDALRDAIGYDPDRIRDEERYGVQCDNCGAVIKRPPCPLCGES